MENIRFDLTSLNKSTEMTAGMIGLVLIEMHSPLAGL